MGARRSYAFHPDITQVNGREWTKFLIYWMKNPKQLEAMARLLLVSSAKDLSADTAAVLRKLRDFHQVLLLKKDDSMQRYQCTLKRLDKFGILDLSFALVGPQQKPLFFEQAKTRSLRCKWRESEKRVKLLRRCVTFHSTATQAECEAHKKTKQKLEETKAELARAKKIMSAFLEDHPEWTPPDDVPLIESDSDQFYDAFQQVDKNVDVKAQMKYDPTGCLTTFWEEQRRRLQTNKYSKWNPKVRYVVGCMIISPCRRVLGCRCGRTSRLYSCSTCILYDIYLNDCIKINIQDM